MIQCQEQVPPGPGWVGPGPQSGPLHNQMPPLTVLLGEILPLVPGYEVPPGPFIAFKDFVPFDPNATDIRPPDPSRWSFGEVLPGGPNRNEAPPLPMRFDFKPGDPTYFEGPDPHALVFKEQAPPQPLNCDVVPGDPNGYDTDPWPPGANQSSPSTVRADQIPPGPQSIRSDFKPVDPNIVGVMTTIDSIVPPDPDFGVEPYNPEPWPTRNWEGPDPHRNEAPRLPIMSASAAPLDPDFYDVH